MATPQGNDSSSGCGATSIILELAVNDKGRTGTLSKNAKYCNRWISQARSGQTISLLPNNPCRAIPVEGAAQEKGLTMLRSTARTNEHNHENGDSNRPRTRTVLQALPNPRVQNFRWRAMRKARSPFPMR